MTKKVSFLLALALLLWLGITPAALATEELSVDVDEVFVLDDNRTINYSDITPDILKELSEAELERLKEKVLSDQIEVDGLFVLSDNSVINYDEITAEIVQGLSEAELERLMDKVTADRAKRYPPGTPSIIHMSDEQLQAARERQAAVMQDLISNNKLQLKVDPGARIAPLNIGTNATIQPAKSSTVFSQGNSGGAITSENTNRVMAAWGTTGTGWGDAKAHYLCPGGIGSGYALGLIGLQVPITGSGSRVTSVNIQGTYRGTVQTVGFLAYNDFVNFGSALASVEVSIYEVNPSTGAIISCLANRKVFEQNATFTVLPNDFEGNISEDFVVTLVAGKTYIFSITAYTEAAMAWYNVLTWTMADMYSAAKDAKPGNQGVDFSSVTVTWN